MILQPKAKHGPWAGKLTVRASNILSDKRTIAHLAEHGFDIVSDPDILSKVPDHCLCSLRGLGKTMMEDIREAYPYPNSAKAKSAGQPDRIAAALERIACAIEKLVLQCDP